MAEFFKGLLLSVLSEKCYDVYFYDYNFFDGELNKYWYQKLNLQNLVSSINWYMFILISVPCFKSTLSKGLGIGIIAGAILVKVPQILKILGSKSAEGINVYGVYLELFAITANFAYSYVMKFPFRYGKCELVDFKLCYIT